MTEPLTEHLRRRLTGPPGAELVVGALFSDNGDTGQNSTPLDGVTFRLFRLHVTAPIAELATQSRTGSFPLTDRKIKASLNGEACWEVAPVVAASIGLRRVPLSG